MERCPRCLRRLRAHAWRAAHSCRERIACKQRCSVCWGKASLTAALSKEEEHELPGTSSKAVQNQANKTIKCYPRNPVLRECVCCWKYLLQHNEQKRCLHSNTHLEDKWICTVQKQDKCRRRGRLRLWYLWGLGRVSQVE